MNRDIETGVFIHLDKCKQKPKKTEEYYGVKVKNFCCDNTRWIVFTENEIEHFRDMRIKGVTDYMPEGTLFEAGEGLCGTQNYCAKLIYNGKEIIAFISDHIYRMANERGEKIKDDIDSMY